MIPVHFSVRRAPTNVTGRRVSFRLITLTIDREREYIDRLTILVELVIRIYKKLDRGKEDKSRICDSRVKKDKV